MKKYRILIVVSVYNEIISKGLLNNALKKLNSINFKTKIIKAPGTFEIPFLIEKNIKKYDGVVALGCIIKGETNNFDLISKSITDSLLQLSLKHKKPIGNGIITCFNKKQANSRKDKGHEAAIAVQVVLSSFPKKVS